MAQQTARKQVETAAPKTRAPRLPQAKTSPPSDYSRYRLTFTDADQFMTFMRGYPLTEGVTLFLYRLVPKIDLSLIGKRESNIQKGGYSDLNLYSLESIAEKFGCGKYQVKVTDSNRPDGQREVVRTCQYKITDAGAPVYDVRTLELGHSDNIDEVNRLITSGVLIRDASGAPRLRTASDAAPVVAAPVAGNGDSSFVYQLAMAAVQNAAQSPRDSVKDTIEVARMLMPPPQPVVDLEAIVERVAARFKPSDPLDVFTQYDKIESFIGRFRAPGAGAVNAVGDGVASTDSWAPHLQGILESATSFLNTGMAAFRELRQNGGAAPPPVAAAAAPQNGDVNANPLPPLNQRIEQVFMMGFQEMQKGISGFDFAAWVCLRMPGGLEVYRALEPNGAAGLIALAGANPLAASVVNNKKTRDQLETFLADFCSFDSTTPEPLAGSPAAGS